MRFILLVVCLFLMILLFLQTFRPYNDISEPNSKNYGEKNEETSVLLARIRYANSYRERVNFIPRYLFISIVLSVFSSLIYVNKFPTFTRLFQTTFVLLVFLYAFHHFYDYHCDKFSNYAIDRNVGILRKRLNVENIPFEKLKPRTKTFKPDSKCWNYR